MAAPLRLGLIGAGRWGRIFVQTLERFDAANLVRLASKNPDSSPLVDDCCVISKDWQDVAGAHDIDGVIIAAPPALHAKMTHAAIAAGNPVLVEKPLTQDLNEAIALFEFAKSEDAIVLVDHIHLYHPAYRALKHESLRLGPLQGIRTSGGNWGPVRTDATVLWDWGPHDVSMCLDLLGEKPVSVSARRDEQRLIEDGVGESIALQLTFASGLKADIELSNLLKKKKRFLAAKYDHEILIYDACASDILVREPRSEDVKFLSETATPIDIPDTSPLDQVLTDFTEAIIKAEADLAGLSLGLDVVDVLEACEKALKP